MNTIDKRTFIVFALPLILLSIYLIITEGILAYLKALLITGSFLVFPIYVMLGVNWIYKESD